MIHNFRTELVGSNQIKTVFDPKHEWYMKLEGYDRISQYYQLPENFESDDDCSVQNMIKG